MVDYIHQSPIERKHILQSPHELHLLLLYAKKDISSIKSILWGRGEGRGMEDILGGLWFPLNCSAKSKQIQNDLNLKPQYILILKHK